VSIEAKLQIRCWSEQEFQASQAEWQGLLSSSNADPLFLSWAWMANWWALWSRPSTDELYLLAAYINNELVGIAPCYIEKNHYIGKLLPVSRLHFIGHRQAKAGSLRSEYLGLIVKRECEALVTGELVRALFSNPSWDKAILSDLITEHDFQRIIKCQGGVDNARVRTLATSTCYAINTAGSFEDYVHRLGKNTRLKLYGRRKSLVSHGEVELLTGNVVDVNTAMEQIDQFHQRRFDSITFTNKRRALVNRLLAEDSSIQCRSSLLQVNGETLSAMINVEVAGRIYNLQLGYLEDFDRKVSLGTLHLGYAIEDAFNSPAVHTFDLLAGEGKNSDYKQRLAEPNANLESIMIIRNPVVKALYSANDSLKVLLAR